MSGAQVAKAEAKKKKEEEARLAREAMLAAEQERQRLFALEQAAKRLRKQAETEVEVILDELLVLADELADRRAAERQEEYAREAERRRVEELEQQRLAKIAAAKERVRNREVEAIRQAKQAEWEAAENARMLVENEERKAVIQDRALMQKSIGRLEAARRVKEYQDRKAKQQAEYDLRLSVSEVVPCHSSIKEAIPGASEGAENYSVWRAFRCSYTHTAALSLCLCYCCCCCC